jgi:hypothetical protein
MAVTLQSDPDVAGFNAYATRAEVNSFLLEKRLFALTTWEACPNKEAAILWATRELDRLKFAGSRATSANRHEWPRSGITDVDSNEIPDQLKDACAELAYYLCQADRSAPAAVEEFKSIQAGPIKLEYKDAATGPELTSEMPDSVRGLLKRFLKGGTSGVMNRKAVRV